VDLEEELEQLAVGGLLRIEDDLDRLRVRAVVAVARVRDVATRLADPVDRKPGRFRMRSASPRRTEDLTTEYGVRGEFADYGIPIPIDKQLVAFVEVKRVATKLSARHLRQIEMYAVNEGVEWMVLTNGREWRAYHLSGGLPVEVDLALEVDLLADGSPRKKPSSSFT
jgi:Type I restriction enzyme R protein N terminus (HSDR_N)